jgi:choline kinase
MKGVILAAGVASRLRPLTNTTPKCLLQIGQKTILQRTMDNLIHNGVDQFIIVTGYLQDQIISYVAKTYPDLSVDFITNEIYDTTNNIYSLWLTRELINNSGIILLDSDIVFDKQVIHMLLHSGHANCLAMRSDDMMSEEEMKVRVSKDMRITEISKQIAPVLAAGESMGIACFGKPFVSTLMKIVGRRVEKEKQVHDFYEAAFQEAVSSGSDLYAVNIGNLHCVEIDTVEDIEYTIKEVVGELDTGY